MNTQDTFNLIGRIGPLSSRWKGEAASYSAKHSWLSRNYGKATFCENDIKHESSRFEWANISGEYRRDRSDYKRVCRACHAKMDMKKECKHGHRYTKKNTFINANGWRECRNCRASRRHHDKTN